LNTEDIDMKIMELIRSYFNPNKILILKPTENAEKLEKIFPYILEMKLLENKTTVYVCSNYSCKQPTNNATKLRQLLEQKF